MTYAAESRRPGRQPITLAELHLDRCTLTFGTSPCEAVLGVTGTSYCYNTRATCQDPDNYSPTPCAYRFCSPSAPLPVIISGDSPAAFEAPVVPSLRDATFTPAAIDVSGGLGQRAAVSLNFDDHAHHDRWFDPYWRLRGGVGEAVALQAEDDGDALEAVSGLALQARPAGVPATPEGSFWGRFIARNRYYTGRKLVVRSGYITEPYDPAAFVTRTYVIEDLSGPDGAGRVKLTGKDPLKLAERSKAQAPVASTGRLLSGINDSITAATLTPTDIGDEEYPASGWVRMGGEVCAFTRTGDALTLTRGQFGTDAVSHDGDEGVQLCLRYAADSVSDIVYDLITGYTTVDPAYLPKAQWDAETAAYLTQTYSTLITEPTPVDELIKELSQQAAFAIWYHEEAAEVKIRALRDADTAPAILDETSHLIADSVSVTDKPDLRVSQVWVYLAQIDVTDDLEKVTNFRQLVIDADLEAEGPDKFGTPAIRKIFSRWIASRASAQDTAQRLRSIFGESPFQVAFELDAKDADACWTGDIKRLRTRLRQSADGTPAILSGQIISAKEVEAGHRVAYILQVYEFDQAPPPATVVTFIINQNDVNLLEEFTARFGAPTSTTSVTFVVEPGVIIGQELAPAALRTDVWPVGAQIFLENNGRIQGKGGYGGYGGLGSVPPGLTRAGGAGGDALLAESAISVANFGELWGGGGGGGGWRANGGGAGYGGGGGAGTVVGQGGIGAASVSEDGTDEEGGNGTAFAGNGGDPGQPGGASTSIPGSIGGGASRPGGARGSYVINNALVTFTAIGDRRGAVG